MAKKSLGEFIGALAGLGTKQFLGNRRNRLQNEGMLERIQLAADSKMRQSQIDFWSDLLKEGMDRELGRASAAETQGQKNLHFKNAFKIAQKLTTVTGVNPNILDFDSPDGISRGTSATRAIVSPQGKASAPSQSAGVGTQAGGEDLSFTGRMNSILESLTRKPETVGVSDDFFEERASFKQPQGPQPQAKPAARAPDANASISRPSAGDGTPSEGSERLKLLEKKRDALRKLLSVSGKLVGEDPARGRELTGLGEIMDMITPDALRMGGLKDLTVGHRDFLDRKAEVFDPASKELKLTEDEIAKEVLGQMDRTIDVNRDIAEEERLGLEELLSGAQPAIQFADGTTLPPRASALASDSDVKGQGQSGVLPVDAANIPVAGVEQKPKFLPSPDPAIQVGGNQQEVGIEMAQATPIPKDATAAAQGVAGQEGANALGEGQGGQDLAAEEPTEKKPSVRSKEDIEEAVRAAGGNPDFFIDALNSINLNAVETTDVLKEGFGKTERTKTRKTTKNVNAEIGRVLSQVNELTGRGRADAKDILLTKRQLQGGLNAQEEGQLASSYDADFRKAFIKKEIARTKLKGGALTLAEENMIKKEVFLDMSENYDDYVSTEHKKLLSLRPPDLAVSSKFNDALVLRGLSQEEMLDMSRNDPEQFEAVTEDISRELGLVGSDWEKVKGEYNNFNDKAVYIATYAKKDNPRETVNVTTPIYLDGKEGTLRSLNQTGPLPQTIRDQAKKQVEKIYVKLDTARGLQGMLDKIEGMTIPEVNRIVGFAGGWSKFITNISEQVKALAPMYGKGKDIEATTVHDLVEEKLFAKNIAKSFYGRSREAFALATEIGIMTYRIARALSGVGVLSDRDLIAAETVINTASGSAFVTSVRTAAEKFMGEARELKLRLDNTLKLHSLEDIKIDIPGLEIDVKVPGDPGYVPPTTVGGAGQPVNPQTKAEDALKHFGIGGK
jgi:hypothetical protein